jgi:hypothetical protein
MDKKQYVPKHRYGSIIAEYKYERNGRLVVIFLVLLVAVGISYSILSNALESGVRSILEPVIFIRLFFGPFLLYLTINELLDSIKSRKYGLTIYQRGFEHRNKDGTQERNWRGIDTVNHSIIWNPKGVESRITTHSFTIKSKGKPDIKLSKLLAVHEAGSIIQEKAAEYSLPEALDQITRQRRLSFGPFQVSLRGLSNEGVSVPWTELASGELESVWEGFEEEKYLGMINIRKKGEESPWAKFPMDEVPNDYLFLQLVQRGIEEEWGKGLSITDAEIRDLESRYDREEVPGGEPKEIPSSEYGALARIGWIIGGLVGLVVFVVLYVLVYILQLTELKTLLVEYWWLLIGSIALIIALWFMRQVVTKGSGSGEQSSDE